MSDVDSARKEHQEAITAQQQLLAQQSELFTRLRNLQKDRDEGLAKLRAEQEARYKRLETDFKHDIEAQEGEIRKLESHINLAEQRVRSKESSLRLAEQNEANKSRH